MQGTESGTIGALTINAISKSIGTNVDAISFQAFLERGLMRPHGRNYSLFPY